MNVKKITVYRLNNQNIVFTCRITCNLKPGQAEHFSGVLRPCGSFRLAHLDTPFKIGLVEPYNYQNIKL